MFDEKRLRLPLLSRLDTHMREVVRGASIAFSLKVLAAGLGFLVNVALGRLLGADGAGLYFLALTVATIASVIGRFGLDNTLLRFTAASASTENWRAVSGLYRKGMTLAVAASGTAAAAMFFLSPWLAESVFSDVRLTGSLRWMSFSVVPLAISTLYANLFKGLKRITVAFLVLSVLVPAFSLFGIILLVPYAGVNGAVWGYTIATILTLILAILMWRWTTSRFLKNCDPVFDTRKLLLSSSPLLMMACMNLAIQWTSTLVLQTYRSSADVGIFNMANRTAFLTSFVLIAVNSIASPKFAALYAQGDLVSLGRTARNSAKLMALMAGPILLLFLVIPQMVMALFGKQFVTGAPALSIMAVGQFVNVATGSVGMVLMMCGYERLLMYCTILSAVMNVTLNFMLVPLYGVVGAAVATAATLITQNLAAAWFVWRRLGILTIPFPGITNGKQESSESQHRERQGDVRC